MKREVLLKRQNSVAKLVQVDISKWKDAAPVKTTLGAKSGLLWQGRVQQGNLWGEELNRTNLFLWLFAPRTQGNTTASQEKGLCAQCMQLVLGEPLFLFLICLTPFGELEKSSDQNAKLEMRSPD